MISPDEILELTRRHVPVALRERIALDTPLFEDGLLDSLAFLSIVADLEATYQIALGEDQLTLEQFASARRIHQMVTQHV